MNRGSACTSVSSVTFGSGEDPNSLMSCGAGSRPELRSAPVRWAALRLEPPMPAVPSNAGAVRLAHVRVPGTGSAKLPQYVWKLHTTFESATGVSPKPVGEPLVPSSDVGS